MLSKNSTDGMQPAQAIAPQYQESESEPLFVESLNALELKMAE